MYENWEKRSKVKKTQVFLCDRDHVESQTGN